MNFIWKTTLFQEHTSIAPDQDLIDMSTNNDEEGNGWDDDDADWGSLEESVKKEDEPFNDNSWANDPFMASDSKTTIVKQSIQSLKLVCVMSTIVHS